jgi:uncharacterized protein (DUF305 family)
MRKLFLMSVALAVLAAPAWAQSASSPGQAAMQEDQASMQKMMKSMEAVQDMDPDVAFAKKMRAHHQGAVDMANTELKYGNDAEAKAEARNVKEENEKSIRKLDAWLAKHTK